MKQLHECPRSVPRFDFEIYTYDETKDKTWYINGHVVFFCPYCGIDLKTYGPHLQREREQ